MSYVIAAVIFAAVAALVWALLSTFFSEDRAVRKRLGQMTDYEQSEVLNAEPMLKPFSQRVVTPAGQAMSRFASSVTPVGYAERLQHKLVVAGSPRRMDSGRLLTVKFLGAAAVLLFTIGYTVIRGGTVRVWLVGVILAVLAFFVPDIWLTARGNSRRKQIRRELPDMLDMLTISVEAGLGFDQAISKYVRNSDGPLAQEFARMLQEVQAGVDRTTALRNLAARTDVPDLNTFLTAIMQAETFGISISNVLRTQAAEMRLKRRQMAEEIAQKAPVKMVFPLILCILPATLIVVLGPAIVSVGRAFGLIAN